MKVSSKGHILNDDPGIFQKIAGEGRRKSGSAMSDKQMARAAVSGQLLEFTTGVLMPIEGYVVGMDDYHWLVAMPSDGPEGLPVRTALIHKTCPLVMFYESHLVDETEDDRKKIQGIGKSFWDFCVTSGLTRSVSTDQEQNL